MLTTCPECELQVSDKALSCPHCGYPLQQNSPPRKKRTSKKRRRLPNGFGQISEIKGRNLRNPFRAMVTVGKHENGRPICKPLKPQSYFPTYNDAYAALVEYNKNPYDLTPSITVEELYEQWSEKHYQELSYSRVRNLKGAWEYCSSVYKMRVIDLRTRHIKNCMEDGTRVVNGKVKPTTSSIKVNMKTLFNKMLDYAVEYELVDRNYARNFTIDGDTLSDALTAKRQHISFSEEELDILWKNEGALDFVDTILIQCYSGWRPQEMCLIKIEDVNINEGWFKAGIKTKAGIMRTVPIHPKIKSLVERKYNKALSFGSEYLITYVNEPANKIYKSLTYKRYQALFDSTIKELNLNSEHRPHDARKCFVTMAKKYGVDEYAIKYIVGHTVNDITEAVYTERNFEWLASEMQKIK